MTPFDEYLSIVLFRQRNPHPKGVFCHKHHIIPKSLGGPDEEWNIVLLTPEEHYDCHKLLPFVYPEGPARDKMAKAWHRMHFSMDGNEIDRETYGELMRMHSAAQRRRMLGTKHTQEWKDRMKGRTPWNKGQEGHKHTEEEKRKIGDGNRGKPKCMGMGQHLSEAIMGHVGYFTGKTHSEETKQKLREKAIARGPRGAAAGGIPWTEERRRKVKETWARKKAQRKAQ